MGVVENLINVFQGCLVQFFWKGLEVHGKSSKENDWKEGVEVLKVVMILTEVLIQVKGEGLPKTRWGKLKRWLPEWKDRWEKIEERDSLIYMIVEIATGKVYCGEREQSYSDDDGFIDT